MAASDSDGAALDIFQRSAGVTTPVSTNTAGNANGAPDASFSGSSADGSKAFFETRESMAASDTDSTDDVLERSAGATTLVSIGIPVLPVTPESPAATGPTGRRTAAVAKCKQKFRGEAAAKAQEMHQEGEEATRLS